MSSPLERTLGSSDNDENREELNKETGFATLILASSTGIVMCGIPCWAHRGTPTGIYVQGRTDHVSDFPNHLPLLRNHNKDHGSDDLWRRNFLDFYNSFSEHFPTLKETARAGGENMPDKLFTELEARDLSSCGNVTTRRPTSICAFTDEYYEDFVLNLTTVCRPGAKPQGTLLSTGWTIGATTSDDLDDEAYTRQEL
ncbi:hypothetical protein M231_02544 [Tremella mesenterica]|uniref:Uncharacterized protein n=1 Tax=Tremella mesenterica TaxID=5217 RepID=A0A4V1M4E5_TREME|nr:hypothetical protein M231_02544 [Tremella mesenterica]